MSNISSRLGMGRQGRRSGLVRLGHGDVMVLLLRRRRQQFRVGERDGHRGAVRARHRVVGHLGGNPIGFFYPPKKSPICGLKPALNVI